MADRTTVMSWLEGLAQDDWMMFHSDSEVQEIARSAIALLKEQKEQLDIKTENFNWLAAKSSAMRIVRCKDCKHLEHMYALDELNGKKCYVCRKHSFTGLREENWFCADGERRDDEAE